MGRVTESPPQLDMESEPESESSSPALVMNPALQTLTLMSIVSLVTWTGQQAGDVDPFMLQAPLLEDWWQLPLSVYAHTSPAHLGGNAMLVFIAGGLISLSAGWLRFHLFFLTTGILSGASHVMATDVLGAAVPVLGSSGAAFALLGYLVTGNALSSRLLDRVPVRVIVPIAIGLALAFTIWSAGMDVANIAHFTGMVLGLLAGHVNLLRPRESWGVRERFEAMF